MKAIVHRRYGSPDVLICEEAEKPVPEDKDVLIKVRAASVNPLDWHLMRGSPYFIRLVAGLRKPKEIRAGVDVAGLVEAVGAGVTEFKPGDEVFGSCQGAFAEYACVPESLLALKPASVSFEQAASVPVAAFTAIQGLRDKGKIQPGQRVLINGAAGGVGTFAVQLAKSFGANVTGVCSTRNVAMVRSIGADRVIDYNMQVDFTRDIEQYDLFFDCIGNHSLSSCLRILHPKGTYVLVGGQSRGFLGPIARLIGALLLSRFVSQNMVVFIAKPNKADLILMRELMETGKVTPVIDRQYGLLQAPDAIRYLEEGHARGKVVISLA